MRRPLLPRPALAQGLPHAVLRPHSGGEGRTDHGVRPLPRRRGTARLARACPGGAVRQVYRRAFGGVGVRGPRIRKPPRGRLELDHLARRVATPERPRLSIVSCHRPVYGVLAKASGILVTRAEQACMNRLDRRRACSPRNPAPRARSARQSASSSTAVSDEPPSGRSFGGCSRMSVRRVRFVRRGSRDGDHVPDVLHHRAGVDRQTNAAKSACLLP